MLKQVERLAAEKHHERMREIVDDVSGPEWQLLGKAEAVSNSIVDDFLYHPAEDAVDHEWAVKSLTFGLVAIAFSITEAGAVIAKAIKGLQPKP